MHQHSFMHRLKSSIGDGCYISTSRALSYKPLHCMVPKSAKERPELKSSYTQAGAHPGLTAAG